ncbi:hypothetical protein GpartN1_g691.t1 [Galdieria partita]|uniref:Phosphatidylserine synthase n=1 Tax=Galdieria partita TaxID=83374 RepID=A0A9C7PQY7_9RHOD|nr:hypothetical protein GpartN1_g691.t1 [Galdieria partita]
MVSECFGREQAKGEQSSDGIFQKPHTATLLAVFLGVIVYLAWRNEKRMDTVSNVIQGILCSCLPLLVYGILQFRDGFFQRPHPAVWRLVMGLSLLYLMFLVFLLFQNVSDARKIIGYLDPLNAGRPLPDRSYGDDCRLWTPENPNGSLANLFLALDAFVVAHTLGWFVKALMIRDRVVLWLASSLFELLEYLLKGMLPNFNECWWDSIILDLLCCNLVGIELGLIACKILQTKKYSWRGNDSVSKKTFWKELIGLFGPSSFDKLQWPIFGSLRHFVACSLVIFVLEVADLNAFFLKAILWVQVESSLNVYRILIIALQGFPSAREFYQFLIDPSCQRFGSQAWILVATLTAELLISIKFGRHVYQKKWTEYFPLHIRFWMFGLFTGYIMFASWIAIMDWKYKLRTKNRESTSSR